MRHKQLISRAGVTHGLLRGVMSIYAELVGDIPRLSDEALHHLGELYTANRLFQRGVLFSTFITCPEQTMQAMAYNILPPLPEAVDYYPLLPAQVKVKQRVAFIDDIDAIEDLMTAGIERDAPDDVVVSMQNGLHMESMTHKFPPSHIKCGNRGKR